MDREVLERAQDVQTLASLNVMRDPAASPSVKRNLLNEVRQTYADYLWLGLVDAQGIVTVSSGPLPVGLDISTQPWYVAGRQNFFAGESREPLLPQTDRALALAAPVLGQDGQLQGVVGAYLDYGWVASIPSSWQETIGNLDQARVFILADDGSLLFTTADQDDGRLTPNRLLNLDSVAGARREQNYYLIETWPDDKTYLTGYTRSRAFGPFPGLGWLVLVRQPLSVAYRPVRQLQQQILVLGLGLGLLFLVLGWWLTGRLVRPLSAIADAAERMRRGERETEIPQVGGTDELGLLSRSLRNLVAELRAQQAALEESQQVLERKVAERTRTLAALYRILEVANTADDLQTALDHALQPVLDASGATAGLIHLLSPGGDTLHLLAQANVPPPVARELQDMPLNDGPLGRVLYRGQSLIVDEADAGLPLVSLMQAHGATVCAGIPIIAANHSLGILSLVSTESFDRETLELLDSVGEELGVVVENARLQRRDEELAVLEERNRLARELHDSVTQSLYSVTLYAEAGRRLALAGDTERTVDYLYRLGDTGHQALKEMRLLLHKLRPLALQQEGLVSALRHRLDAVEGKVGVKHRLNVEGQIDLSPGVEEALYHISQEALNNALKHAEATEIMVTLAAGDDDIELLVADNGSGFDPHEVRPGGMGLSTMRERAQRFGGELSVTSAPGQGTTVRVRLQTEQNSRDGALQRVYRLKETTIDSSEPSGSR
jgi:nitrate/nitrite-specific signal transduction histidine kinase